MEDKQPFDFNSILKDLSGDEERARIAFRELHNLLGTGIYVKAKRFLKSSDMADDIVQEVFTNIWEKRKKLGHVLEFENYLVGITKRRVFDLLRKKVKAEILQKKHIELMEHIGRPDSIGEEHAAKIDELVERLPATRKQIFKLAKFQGIDGKTIAAQFKISADMVYWHVSEATKFIKQKMRDVTLFLVFVFNFIQQLFDF
jgi:RNA polymerase sigma factor (sigma-70 family)